MFCLWRVTRFNGEERFSGEVAISIPFQRSGLIRGPQGREALKGPGDGFCILDRVEKALLASSWQRLTHEVLLSLTSSA